MIFRIACRLGKHIYRQEQYYEKYQYSRYFFHIDFLYDLHHFLSFLIRKTCSLYLLIPYLNFQLNPPLFFI